MPKLKLTVSWPQLDRERYLADFRKAVDQAVIKAARKFLLAAVPRIPIYSGMARGALSNLEDVAGRVDNGRIRGTLGGWKNRKKFNPNTVYYYPPGKNRVVRTNLQGRKFATKAKEIISEGRLTKATKGSRIVFKFSVDITYFDYLDKNKWGAFKAGKAAFDAELKKRLKTDLPQLGKYLIRREIK